MGILILLLGILAVILGFVGFVFIIKGFIDKDDKKIHLGTIFMCVMLIIGVSGAFYIGKSALGYKFCQRNQTTITNDNECKKGSDNEIIGKILDCAQGDMTAKLDSNGLRFEMKFFLDKKQYQKKCMKKDGQKCGQHN
jgi:hypothetical protein